MLVPIRPDVVESFCPGTLLNPQRFQRTDLSVFTFGMAHKIRVPLYRRLHRLLEATGKSYSIYVSTALHENTSFDESFIVRFEELQAIFGGAGLLHGLPVRYGRVQSDCGLHVPGCVFREGSSGEQHQRDGGDGMRLYGHTNLDEHSPKGLAHLKNVIDINVCDRLPDFEQAEKIGRAAREIAQAGYRVGCNSCCAAVGQLCRVAREKSICQGRSGSGRMRLATTSRVT